ncbi:AAA family ATPase [Leptotrichia sp.]|jgi:ATPase, AAA family|uniref:AAA family ATPase n=1 Tax=Leptotrichia sp. TaxID=104608 RepID=UPI0017CE7FA5|nr:AAA family ATPase [Leptotrichia sp.]MBB1534293.1 ATP-dependent Clp protease ATP-binding subunit [Leptotrichia sp.]VTX60008.1 Chaperone protein ClpB [uncultured Leptotrichia sp.]
MITIYFGPKVAFEKVIPNNSKKIHGLMELIRQSDKKRNIIYLNEIKEDKEKKEKIEVLVGKSEEYSMIKEEALNDFVTILEEYKIEDMYFQNPPKLIFEMLKKSYKKKEIKIEYFEFKDIDEKIILEINSKFDTKIIGQNNVKEKLLINLYSNIKKLKTKPLILMFYGPSGVGKTETAKYLSEILGEKLFRKQFSMYQNNSFFDYVFGEKHGISSLARDLLNRESNVILFDEFDKAESTFYSAFYQLFDEGILIDKNYEVKLKNSIIICTSNYRNLLDIKKKLGEAIYSRFDDFIEFKTINYNDMANIAKQMYEKNLIKLNLEEQKIIEESKIFNTIIDNIKKFYNVRQLEKIIIQLIAKELLKNKLNDFENMNN